MIDHIVMLSLEESVDPAELAAVMSELEALVGQIEGFTSFVHGPNIDLEGKSASFPYGFIGQFASRAVLKAYAADPRHQALGARLVALCKGGAAGITVFDIERA